MYLQRDKDFSDFFTIFLKILKFYRGAGFFFLILILYFRTLGTPFGVIL